MTRRPSTPRPSTARPPAARPTQAEPAAPRARTLGEALEQHRLALRVQRLERVIAALEERVAAGGVVAPPLRHAIRDFRAELDRTRAQLHQHE